MTTRSSGTQLYNMSRSRSISFPWPSTAKRQEGQAMSNYESPLQSALGHSRNSSGASSASAPITPTFSHRSHNRWPSSSSSLGSAPDSPVNITKSALHDLVEEPAERDDALDELPASGPEEPLCICDEVVCEHRATPRVSQSVDDSPSTPEWTPGDDFLRDGELPVERTSKRPRSGELVADTLTSRLTRRWPSISQRWRDHKPTVSVSNHSVRSTPPSRSSSVRLPSLRRSLATHVEPTGFQSLTPPFTPIENHSEDNVLSRPRAMSRPTKPVEIFIPEPMEDPIDRQELASTPLLPPITSERMLGSTEDFQSPLQSPSVASPHSTNSVVDTPMSTPMVTGMPTPPLSSKPSVTSFGLARSALALHPSSEIPHMAISEETDLWAIRLGHANFHIRPEPYMPEVSNVQTCRRLIDDWEAARVEYMRLAARISEHYGPTSQTYKFTEQKWSEIDDQWREYHERANAQAEASGDSTLYQPLAETQLLSKMPSLNDPAKPSKFPGIDETDIVGPMVQYCKIQHRPSRRPTFLKIFTDPASLLGALRR